MISILRIYSGLGWFLPPPWTISGKFVAASPHGLESCNGSIARVETGSGLYTGSS